MSGPHPAHPAELTARCSGTFSILRPARHLLSPARPQLWDGAWGCPPCPPEKSRASRRVPGVPLPNGEEGGLPLGACRRGPPPPRRPAAPPPELAPRQGLHPRALARLAGPYLVWSPQQPVDPGQLGAEREVLAEREQRRPAGLGEVGAVERVCVVQELHPASQRGHDASLPLGARAPGMAGRRAGAPGSLRAGEAAAAALWLAGSQAPARRVAARATAAGGRGGGGAGAGGPPRSSPAPAPPLLRPPCSRPDYCDPPDPPPGMGRGEWLGRHPQPYARSAGGGGGSGTQVLLADWLADATWAASCMCAPRLGEPRPRYTAPSSGNRGGGGGVRGCPLASSHLGEGFTLSRRRQRWRAPTAGIRKTPAGHREVKEPASGSKRSIGSTWSPGKVSLGEKEAKKEEGASGNPGNSYEISPGAASRAQRQPGLTPWAAWRMLLAPLHHRGLWTS